MTLKERLGLSDRDILAKTLQAEAGNQGVGGMLAAGSVIMNRAKSSGYGGGVQDVILKPGQFSPWNSETNYAGGAQGQDMINLAPSREAYQVADNLLSGNYKDPTSGATHFYNPDISNPSWGAEKQGGDWTRIGSHLFGKADAGRSSNQLVADDAMRAIGKQPIGLADANITGLADANIKENSQMMQQQRPRGLLADFGIQKMQEGAEGETGQRFYNRDTFKDRLADLAVAFGKMGIMGLDEPAAAVANRRAARRDTNKTMEAISKMGTPQSEQAIAFLNAGGDPVSALKIAFAKPGEASAKEMQIQRLMATGVPRDTAIGIADRRLVPSKDPITGEVVVVDLAKMAPGNLTEEVAPEEVTEEPVDSFVGANVPGSFGISGFGANIMNTVMDAFGGGQPADDIAKASTILRSLATRTSLGLAAEFPGRPSNLTREMIQRDLTISPSEISTGKGKALDKANEIVRMIEASLKAANAVVGGKFSATDKAAAQQSIRQVSPLLDDYKSLIKRLEPEVAEAGVGGLVIAPNVLDRLKAYENE
jgi:hypothetical protein